jgi:hypothetical protein
MPTSMLNVVSLVSCGLGIACVLLFVYLVLTTPRRPLPAVEGDRADAVRPHGAIADSAKLIEAMAKLTDSLEKAGPMIGSLVGGIFFLLLAALAAGLAK